MKGVSYIIDSRNRKKAVVIDWTTLDKYAEKMADLLKGIIAESRKDEPSSRWEDVKKHLKEMGKL